MTDIYTRRFFPFRFASKRNSVFVNIRFSGVLIKNFNVINADYVEIPIYQYRILIKWSMIHIVSLQEITLITIFCKAFLYKFDIKYYFLNQMLKDYGDTRNNAIGISYRTIVEHLIQKILLNMDFIKKEMNVIPITVLFELIFFRALVL